MDTPSPSKVNYANLPDYFDVVTETIKIESDDILVVRVEKDMLKELGSLQAQKYLNHLKEQFCLMLGEKGKDNNVIICASDISIRTLSPDQLLRVGLRKIAPLEALAEEAE